MLACALGIAGTELKSSRETVRGLWPQGSPRKVGPRLEAASQPEEVQPKMRNMAKVPGPQWLGLSSWGGPEK